MTRGKLKKMNTTQNHATAKSRMYLDSHVIRPFMTLPELVALAESFTQKPSILTKAEENLLLLLLQSFALELLEDGQSVNLGPVILAKSLNGDADIVFKFASKTRQFPPIHALQQMTERRPAW